MNIDKWLKNNTKSLDGKTVAITGATGGLGEELCLYLASLSARLIIIYRSNKKAEALKSRILASHPNAELTFIEADLEDMGSVKAATDKLSQLSVDILILNAGAYSIPRRITSCGYDNVFTINFISQYYMARRLAPHIKAVGGRIVAVSSIAHNYSKSRPEDLDFRNVTASSRVYGNAKRYITFALARLLEGEDTLSIVHPGISFTGITNHYPPLIFALIKHPMKWIFMKPKTACLSIVKGIFKPTPEGFWIGPSLFDVWGNPKYKPLKTAKAGEIERIFSVAEEIAGEIYNKIDLIK